MTGVEGIRLETGNFGKRAVATAAWTETMTRYLVNYPVAELELNDGKGWPGGDLSFLRNFPDLRSLKILQHKQPTVAPIHCLHKLKSLDVITYCSTEIRFSEFPELEDCALEWRPKAVSLFDCTTLRKLFVNRYKGHDTEPFGRLVNLESLAILNSPVASLQGLAGLSKLHSLRLGNLRRLESLDGIEHLSALVDLDINTCRNIRVLDPIRALTRLRRLQFNNCGTIETLAPLDSLDRIEMLGFYESTNIIDGDLSPLVRQKFLSRLTFQNRRHYSHRREEFQAYRNPTPAESIG